MNAHETLAKIVAQEAQKLLERSTAAKDSLGESDLAALESLAACVKSLRVPAPSKPSDSPEETVGDLLEAAK